MTKVGIVTDSTCDLHPEALAALRVKMVPLKVLIDGESYRDWIDIEPAGFYERLPKASTLPKTSQPSPAEFQAAYEALAAEGCEQVVSIHLSSALSGTISSATIAAADSPIPVHVIDTRKASQGVALVVKAAVEARDAGLDGEAVAARAHAVSERMRLYFVLETLDYLVKGGRAGKAQGLAAALLNIKPVLDVNTEGIVEPFKKAKGRKRALAELAAHVAQESRDKGRVQLTLLHGCTPSGAEELRAELDAAGADYELESTGLVGAVIGTYTGPGAIGCAYHAID